MNAMSPDTLEAIRRRKWFYNFDLPDGSRTPSFLPAGVELIHDTRLKMLNAVLDAEVGDRAPALSLVDLACNQGWFALQMARRGFRQILGVDQRTNLLEDAALMAQALGVAHFQTRQVDIEDAVAESIGQHDVTLMLGLLYHLENPVRALRLARAITREVFVIETQVVPHMSGMVDWGSYQFQRYMVGSFGVVDETAETHANEASTRGICLAPSIETLAWMLGKVGFPRVEMVPVPEGGHEQLVGRKRVMFAAYTR